MLSIYERCLYWTVWLGTALYILYRFSVESSYRYPRLDKSDFIAGWSILGRSKDVSDQEWTVLTEGWNNYWPWFAGHLCLKAIRKCFSSNNKSVSALIYTLYSLLFMLNCFGYIIPLLYLAMVFLGILLCVLKNRLLGYITALSLLYFLHTYGLSSLKKFSRFQTYEIVLIELGFSWLVAKILAFTLDVIADKSGEKISTKIPLIFVYSFYLPVFFIGPISTFESFAFQFNRKDISWTLKYSLCWFVKVIKIVVYFFALEYLLHYLYSSSIQFYPDLAEKMDAWTLCGLGYSLSVLFHLKYVIIYGFSHTLAEFDDIEFPPPPKCISRLNFNTTMWKHFDRGLYLWITRYFYIPLTGPKRQLHRRMFASFCCFIFIAQWHGAHSSVNLWCFFNFLAVSGEMAVYRFYQTKLLAWRLRNISDENFRRLSAALGSVSFFHLCLSCMLFLSNWDVGLLFYKKILLNFPSPFLPTLFIMYCMSHVSLELNHDDLKKIPKLE